MSETREWYPVSQEEFDQFVASYPHVLVLDVKGFCEPPVVAYHDFSLFTGPENQPAGYHELWNSIVASHSWLDSRSGVTNDVPTDFRVDYHRHRPGS